MATMMPIIPCIDLLMKSFFYSIQISLYNLYYQLGGIPLIHSMVNYLIFASKTGSKKSCVENPLEITGLKIC